jgi:hypothetical protein
MPGQEMLLHLVLVKSKQLFPQTTIISGVIGKNSTVKEA